jgi:hypothetical protein
MTGVQNSRIKLLSERCFVNPTTKMKVRMNFINNPNHNSWFILKGVLLLLIIVLQTSCATLMGDSASTASSNVSGSSTAASTGDKSNSSSAEGAPILQSTPLTVQLKAKGPEVVLENSTFDLPVEMNPSVQKWINYFTGKGRSMFERYLERSEYFIPFLKPILKNAKAPEDLVYLAMIESGFNNNAKSHARAVGAWQFIAPTGRRYGLNVNWWIDERRDVEKSTVSAIQYLKELNSMFSSWPLAAAGYNAGENKIIRAIKKYKTHDFWSMCKAGRFLKPETKNYVPKLYAAAIIGKNRKQFGFEESYTKLKLTNGLRVAANDDAKLEKLPDALEGDKEKVTGADSESTTDSTNEPTVEITKNSPADADEESMLAEDSVEIMLKDMSNPNRTPHVNRHGEVAGDILVEVEIPSPADLFKVAGAAGLTYTEFKSMNPELLRWVTPPEMKAYKVRMPLSHKDDFMKKYFASNFERDVAFLEYKARKGDTAKTIAKRFGINPDPVAEMNSMSVKSSIMPGKLVLLPIPSDFVRSLASLKSLDLLDPAFPKRQRHRRMRFRKVKKQARKSSSYSEKAASSF